MTGATPTPVKVEDNGAARLAELTVKVPVAAVRSVGRNVTLIAQVLLPANEAHVYWNGVISRDLVNTPLPGAMAGILGDLSPQGDDLEAYLRFDQQYYLPDDLLATVDPCDVDPKSLTIAGTSITWMTTAGVAGSVPIS